MWCHVELTNELDYTIESPILDSNDLKISNITNIEINKILTSKLTFKDFTSFGNFLSFIIKFWKNLKNKKRYNFGLKFIKLVDNLDY